MEFGPFYEKNKDIFMSQPGIIGYIKSVDGDIAALERGDLQNFQAQKFSRALFFDPLQNKVTAETGMVIFTMACMKPDTLQKFHAAAPRFRNVALLAAAVSGNMPLMEMMMEDMLLSGIKDAMMGYLHYYTDKRQYCLLPNLPRQTDVVLLLCDKLKSERPPIRNWLDLHMKDVAPNDRSMDTLLTKYINGAEFLQEFMRPKATPEKSFMTACAYYNRHYRYVKTSPVTLQTMQYMRDADGTRSRLRTIFNFETGRVDEIYNHDTGPAEMKGINFQDYSRQAIADARAKMKELGGDIDGLSTHTRKGLANAQLG